MVCLIVGWFHKLEFIKSMRFHIGRRWASVRRRQWERKREREREINSSSTAISGINRGLMMRTVCSDLLNLRIKIYQFHWISRNKLNGRCSLKKKGENAYANWLFIDALKLTICRCNCFGCAIIFSIKIVGKTNGDGFGVAFENYFFY